MIPKLLSIDLDCELDERRTLKKLLKALENYNEYYLITLIKTMKYALHLKNDQQIV